MKYRYAGKFIVRPADSWVLGRCVKCQRANYIEPHGTTAGCVCQADGAWTEHEPIERWERQSTDLGDVFMPKF